MKKHNGNRSISLRSLLLLCLFTLLQCLSVDCAFADNKELLACARARSAENFIELLKNEKRCKEINGIAVLEIENDSEGGMRSALNSRMPWDVFAPQGHKEIEAITKAIKKQLEEKDWYKLKTLITLGNLEGYRYVIIGKVDVNEGMNATTVAFDGQLLDMKTGKIISKRVKGTCCRKLGAWDLASNLFVGLMLFALLFVFSCGNVGRGLPRSVIIMIWGTVIVSWGIIFILFYESHLAILYM